MAINLGSNEIKKISLGNVEIAKISLGEVEVYSSFEGIAGDESHGFYGEVSVTELISGDSLASMLSFTTGTSQNSNEPWLKFALDGKILYVAKKPYRRAASWARINNAKAITGETVLTIKGNNYKVRLLRGIGINESYHYSEFNKLMLPIQVKAGTKAWAHPENVENDLPYWGIDYTDADLGFSDTGAGTCCMEVTSGGAIYRGSSSSDASYVYIKNITYYSQADGWRPVLELVG